MRSLQEARKPETADVLRVIKITQDVELKVFGSNHISYLLKDHGPVTSFL